MALKKGIKIGLLVAVVIFLGGITTFIVAIPYSFFYMGYNLTLIISLSLIIAGFTLFLVVLIINRKQSGKKIIGYDRRIIKGLWVGGLLLIGGICLTGASALVGSIIGYILSMIATFLFLAGLIILPIVGIIMIRSKKKSLV